MFFLRKNTKHQGQIYDWLMENKEAVLSGSAEYEGTTVTDKTELSQFEYVISLAIITFDMTTGHYLPTRSNNYLQDTSRNYNIITCLFGWWGFPWGPLCTVRSIATNLKGGKKQTAASLIMELEYGWKAPSNVSITGHQKDIVQLTERAATEIRDRMEQGNHSDHTAVRIVPTQYADAECQIEFDFPVSDGRDWVDQSRDLTVLIDKNDASQMEGLELDFSENTFWLKEKRISD